MINPRPFKHYGIDTHKDLGIAKRCARPFDTLLIDKTGSCYACECTSWLPQSVGNLQLMSIRDIIRSATADTLRASINDGSYRYCNTNQCLYLRNLEGAPWEERQQVAGLRELRLAMDDSCNLSCPSCRVNKIFVKAGSRFATRIKMVDRVLEYMERDHGTGPLNIHIGSDGDPFASLVYRNFMRRVPRLEHVTYTMQTNGLLIRQMYPRVRHIFDRMKTLNISIDGATRQTYESLRRGGSWHKIRENLDFVTELKHKHGFRLHLHMVVQNANWREMPTMLALAREHDADTVYFNPVQDWNTSDRFPEMAVPESDPQFRAVLEQIKRDPIANAW